MASFTEPYKGPERRKRARRRRDLGLLWLLRVYVEDHTKGMGGSVEQRMDYIAQELDRHGDV